MVLCVLLGNDALLDGMRNYWIVGADIDVTETEPVRENYILYKLRNVIIAPYLVTATNECRHGMARLTMLNLLAGHGGRILPYFFWR